MAVTRPWTERLVHEVQQCPGIEHEELIRRVTPWVPQGHAYRARERRNEMVARRRRRAHGLPEDTPRMLDRPQPHAAEVHRVGARVILRSSIINLVRHGRLVRQGDRLYPATQVERPTCDASGQGTADDDRGVWLWL